MINDNIYNARSLYRELYDRRGWEALGYRSWRECVLKEFGGKQAYAYFQLSAAKVEKNLSTIVEKPMTIPESHLRPLAALPPEEQREIYQKALESAPDGKVTAAHIEKTINDLHHKEIEPASNAMAFADSAINRLEQISQDDPLRPEAIHKVADWCTNQIQWVHLKNTMD
jgi:hypothetical protein